MEDARLDVEAGSVLLREPIVGSVWRGQNQASWHREPR